MNELFLLIQRENLFFRFLILTDGSLGFVQWPLVHNVSEHGQQESDGLPTSGLSDANEVSTRHGGGDCLSLDWCGLLVGMPGYI